MRRHGWEFLFFYEVSRLQIQVILPHLSILLTCENKEVWGSGYAWSSLVNSSVGLLRVLQEWEISFYSSLDVSLSLEEEVMNRVGREIKTRNWRHLDVTQSWWIANQEGKSAQDFDSRHLGSILIPILNEQNNFLPSWPQFFFFFFILKGVAIWVFRSDKLSLFFLHLPYAMSGLLRYSRDICFHLFQVLKILNYFSCVSTYLDIWGCPNPTQPIWTTRTHTRSIKASKTEKMSRLN